MMWVVEVVNMDYLIEIDWDWFVLLCSGRLFCYFLKWNLRENIDKKNWRFGYFLKKSFVWFSSWRVIIYVELFRLKCYELIVWLCF